MILDEKKVVQYSLFCFWVVDICWSSHLLVLIGWHSSFFIEWFTKIRLYFVPCCSFNATPQLPFSDSLKYQSSTFIDFYWTIWLVDALQNNLCVMSHGEQYFLHVNLSRKRYKSSRIFTIFTFFYRWVPQMIEHIYFIVGMQMRLLLKLKWRFCPPHIEWVA